MNIKPNITVPARVERVIDGDTVDVEVCFSFRVRLDDCWAPEKRYHAGKRSSEFLRSVLPVGSKCLVRIDLEKVDQLHDIFTFGRILGRIFNDTHGDVAERSIESGHATRTKQG